MVVDASVRRRKRVLSAQAVKESKYGLAVSLQRLLLRTAPDSGNHEFEVDFDGKPVVVDYLQLSSWPVLRAGMRVWTSTPIVGGLRLRDARPACPRTAWSDALTPALVHLEQLALADWTHGSPPVLHTADSPKTFLALEPVVAKPYLQCLRGLHTLLAERGLHGLPSGQASEYYSCVLASSDPSSIPVGAEPAAYRNLLKAAAVADVVAEEVLDGERSASEASVVSAEVVVSYGDDPVAQPRKRKARTSARTATGSWAGLAWCPAPSAPADSKRLRTDSERTHALPAGGDVPEADASPDGIALAAGSLEAPRAAVPPPAASRRRRARRAADGQQRGRFIIEGRSVTVEQKPPPRPYNRGLISCPWHADCHKKRSFGHREDVADGLDDTGCFAFLGVWVRDGQNETAEWHRHFYPSRPAVREYAQMLGWRPPASTDGAM